MYRRLDDKVLIAGQIRPEDVADLAASGITTIVDNRPDGEEPGQPTASAIAAAALEAGLEFRFVPVAGMLSPVQIEQTADAIEQAEGQVLLYCRSGTRSAWLWALVRASRGADGEGLIASAASAGYDLSGLRPHLARTGDEEGR